MRALLILGPSAFLLCLILTPLCRDFFIRRGWVDHPDELRKLHAQPVPRIGGIPIALSYGGALLFVLFLNPLKTKLYIQHEHLFHVLIPAAALVFGTGLLDDLRGLLPWQKLSGQLTAAVVAVTFGVRLELFPTHPSISFVLSVFWLVGCTNAVNLIDGMDGLATGVGLMASLTTLLVALLGGNVGLALATIPLVGCLIAFLRYNFAPASIFLGDCGSLTIGFLLGCFGLIWSQRAGTLLGMLAPLMVLSLPLLDVGVAVCRRTLRSVSIFKADRGHIHHMVLGLGFSTRHAALMLYGVCGLSALLAILANASPGGLRLPILIVFCALVLFGIKQLGYVEFAAARHTLSGTSILQAVKEEIFLREFEQALRQAESLESWWSVICGVCHQLEFASAHLELHGGSFSAQFAEHSGLSFCLIHLHSGLGSRLMLKRVAGSTMPRLMMAVVHQLQSSLEHRTHALEASSIPRITTAA